LTQECSRSISKASFRLKVLGSAKVHGETGRKKEDEPLQNGIADGSSNAPGGGTHRAERSTQNRTGDRKTPSDLLDQTDSQRPPVSTGNFP